MREQRRGQVERWRRRWQRGGGAAGGQQSLHPCICTALKPPWVPLKAAVGSKAVLLTRARSLNSQQGEPGAVEGSCSEGLRAVHTRESWKGHAQVLASAATSTTRLVTSCHNAA